MAELRACYSSDRQTLGVEVLRDIKLQELNMLLAHTAAASTWANSIAHP